jgi:hypothetical protein
MQMLRLSTPAQLIEIVTQKRNNNENNETDFVPEPDGSAV